MPTEPSVNEQIAREVMGWKAGTVLYRREDGLFQEIPDFEHSLDACRIAEDEIERRNLDVEYLEAFNLMYAALPDEEGIGWNIWLIRLTPAQRCQAMLMAARGR